MFEKWKKLPYAKKVKNSLALASGIILTAGAVCGIVIPSVNLSNSILVDNDFKDGRTFQINLSLVDANGNFIQDINSEEELLKESSSYLVKLLENKGLTNIKVNYGFQYQDLGAAGSPTQENKTSAVNPNPFVENNKKIERYGTLIATFNNNPSALGLNDIENSVNKFYNDHQIYNDFIKSNRYSLEVIPSSSKFSGIPSNGRWEKNSQNNNQNGLFVFKSAEGSYTADLAAQFELINNKENYDSIEAYVDPDGNTSSSKVDIKSKNTYNVGAFVNDLNSVNEIKAANSDSSSSDQNTSAANYSYPLNDNDIKTYLNQTSQLEETPPSDSSNNGDQSSSSEPSQPNPVDQFQTTATWVLWNDKDGLINYLNNLIISWYFNLYANIPYSFDTIKDDKGNITVKNVKPQISDYDLNRLNKDNLNSILFDTADYNYANYVDINLRNQINTYINSLSDVEKEFMAFCAVGLAGDTYGGTSFHPILINDNNLIPILYKFYTSEQFTGYAKPDPNTSSQSVMNGWGWIESNIGSTPVSELLGNHLVSFIDYRNFQDYFVNPNLPDTSSPDYKDTDPIQPYYINNFLLSDSALTADQLKDQLLNGQYKFPVKSFNQQKFIDDFDLFEEQFCNLGAHYPSNINNDQEYTDYENECNALANKYIQPSLIFSNQYKSQPTILNTYGGMSSLDILFIVISCLIFLVGIFISVRYRVPGFIAFILTGLTYVLSIFLYNIFGFGFSFFTLIASTINAFISYMISTLFCKGVWKEIKENNNVSGAVINALKKYWRLSLDINAVLILSSLAFLFFGEINNINIGAILIISSFLSFIINGVIYFILILLYTIWLDVTYQWLYVSNKKYKWLINFSNKCKSSKFINLLNKTFINVNYFSKSAYISLLAIVLVMIGGVVILFVLNPISSTDFTSSNIIFINNFDSLGMSSNDVIRMLGVSPFNSYVYDNQMVIYTTNHINADELASKLAFANNISLLNNVQLTYLSSEISNQLVFNTFKCIGIAIGFSAIWYLISLNIVSVLPIIITQGLFILLFLGMTGATRIPFDINSIVLLVFMFMIATASTIMVISQLKRNYNKHQLYSFKEFKEIIVNNFKKTNLMQILLYSFVIIFGVISCILVSSSLVYSFVLLIILGLAILLVNNLFIAICWYWSNIIFNKFTKQLSISEKQRVKFDYDSVNEQPIKNLNC